MGAVVILPVLVVATLVLTLTEQMWWLIFVFGWAIFPAFGLFIRGIAGLLNGEKDLPSGKGKEREILEVLRDRGELTPARAAMETSLTVAEADKMLKKLAEGGHLDVRVRGGGLFYALWEPDGEGVARRLEGRDEEGYARDCAWYHSCPDRLAGRSLGHIKEYGRA